MIEISRNSKCPCGSGKKYKVCCLAQKDLAPETPSFVPPTFPPTTAQRPNVGPVPAKPATPSPEPKIPVPPEWSKLPKLTHQDNVLRVEHLISMNEELLGMHLKTLKFKEVVKILDSSAHQVIRLTFSKARSEIVLNWHSSFVGEGELSIDAATHKLSGRGHADIAMVVFYQLYHHIGPFFKTVAKKPTLRWWESSPPESNWAAQKYEENEKIHLQLQSLYGEHKIKFEAIILALNLQKMPPGLTSKKVPALEQPQRAGGWRFQFDNGSSPNISVLFSNNQRIPLDEYAAQPLLSLLPSEIWQTEPTLPADHLKTSKIFFYSHTGEIFANILRHYKNLKFGLMLCHHKVSDKAYVIPEISLLRPEDTHWSFKGLPKGQIDIQGHFSSLPQESCTDLTDGILFDSRDSRLWLHHLSRQAIHLRDEVGLMPRKDTLAPGFVTHSQRDAYKAYQWLEQNHAKIELDNCTALSASELNFRFNFFADQPEAFRVELVLPNIGQLQHLPDFLFTFFRGLNHGLPEFLDADKESMVTSRKGEQRQAELKIVRHRGLALQLFLKMCEFVCHESEQPKDFFAQFKKDLSPTLNLIAYGAKSELIFKSTRFDKFLKDLFQRVQEKPRFLIFLNDQTISVPLEKYYALLLSLIRYIAQLDINHLTKSSGFSRNICAANPEEEFDLCAKGVQPQELSLNLVHQSVFPGILPHLPEKSEIYFNGSPLEDLSEKDLVSSLQIQDSDGSMDWFELDPRIYFKGEEISMTEALKLMSGPMVEFKGKYYRIDTSILPNIKWLEYLWNRLQTFQNKSKVAPKGASKFFKVPRSASLEILALRAAGLKIEGGGEQWRKICQGFDALSQHRDETFVPVLPKVTTPLKDYQKIGVQWMLDLYQLHLGGILADDMGLGKTLQTLSFFSLLQHRGELGLALVVVPTSLVYNWLSEIQKFTPELPVKVFEANFKTEGWDIKEGLIICSYGLFQKHGEFIEAQPWNIAVFDEAQNLKNINSLRCSQARALKAKSKFCLTGTPLENHYGEFYSLIDLVVPGALGPYAPFMAIYGPKKGQGGPNVQDLEFLKLKTKPLVLRRDKKRVLSELPPKTENVIVIPFEKQQEKIYREIAVAWNDRVRAQVDQKGEAQSQLQMLTALLRLRQVCSHPASLPNITYKGIPPKVEMLVEQVEAILDKGESVLVFTNFTATLHYIEGLFENHHHTALTLHGGMTGPQRRKVLAEFENSDQPMLLIMTLKTGGVGLNLTKANHVFHLEPWWNPAAENQGTDRVHRIGQDQHVHVVRFIMENSIEEKIQTLKLSKTQAFDALFSESVEELDALSPATFAKKQLTQSDFAYLLDLDNLNSKKP